MREIQLLERIVHELDEYQLTQNQKKGFLFHLGYSIDQYAKYIGVYGHNGLLKNRPVTNILPDNIEVDEEKLSYSTDSIRSCYYTFAKVIQEIWIKNEKLLDEYINVGPQYLYTGELNYTLWENNIGKSFIGVVIDTGTLDFLECLGSEMDEIEADFDYHYVWHGNYLAMWSMMDDYQSYSFIVDKINAVMSPYLKSLINYPLYFELNKENLNQSELLVQVLLSSLKLEENPTFRQMASKWVKDSLLDSNGNLKKEYQLNSNNLGSLLMQFAIDGFHFKYSLNSVQTQDIENAGNVFDLGELIGTDIDLGQYASIIAQISDQQFGYDFRDANWLNKGVYLQFLSFYFILSMRYSVYFKSLKNNE
jgi:hypothetical protein